MNLSFKKKLKVNIYALGVRVKDDEITLPSASMVMLILTAPVETAESSDAM